MLRFRTLAVSLLAAAYACGGGRAPETTAAPTGATTPAITPADLKIRSSIFADDSMQGRRAGTPGNVRGNAYIAAELERLGVRPAGDSGGYLQHVPLASYSVDTTKSNLRAGSATLSVFRDFFPYQPTFAVPVRPIDGAQMVYVGASADSASLPTARSPPGQGGGVPQRGQRPIAARARPEPAGSAGADRRHRGHSDRSAARPVRRLPERAALEVEDGNLTSRRARPSRACSSFPRRRSRSCSASRSTRSGPASRPDAPGRRRASRVELPATNVVARPRRLRSRAPRRVRRARRAQRRDRHRAAGGSRQPARLQHRHPPARRERHAADARRRRRRPGSGHASTACAALRPARLDSIVNGADDDGSGSMGLLEIAESRGARARASPSGRCSSSGTAARSRGCREVAGSPTIRPCRATRSSPRSTST